MSPQSAGDTPVPGDLVGGKYRLVREIGRGGMGVVFEARHEAIDRPVALKTLHADLAAKPHLLARFQREARLPGSLGHDNICDVTDFGTIGDGSLFLVMPLLRGSSLADLLRVEGVLQAPRAVDIIDQILDGLIAAHGAGVVHRDLKPENVFMTRVGDRRDFVKILDFGIAKIAARDIADGLTAPGVVLGTPHYMAPEQARGSKELDQRVDVYAAGVILFEMLTGRKPYPGDSYNEVLSGILTEPFPRPRSLNSSISTALETIVIRAMAKDPAERFQTAAQMRSAVDEAVGCTVSASRGERTRGDANTATAVDMPIPSIGVPRKRRNASLIGVAAAATALCLIGAVYLAVRADDTPRASAPRTEEPAAPPENPVKSQGVVPVKNEPPTSPSKAPARQTREKNKRAAKSASAVTGKVKGRFGTSITSNYDDE
jgi:eukaryotic-like serine/threonine-protein kinase